MANAPVLNIGTTQQLFVDDDIIDRTEGVCRTLDQPAKYAGSPLMFPLHPWEGRVGSSDRHDITWRQASFDSLKGKTVRLKFYLRHAHLCSFTQG